MEDQHGPAARLDESCFASADPGCRVVTMRGLLKAVFGLVLFLLSGPRNGSASRAASPTDTPAQSTLPPEPQAGPPAATGARGWWKGDTVARLISFLALVTAAHQCNSQATNARANNENNRRGAQAALDGDFAPDNAGQWDWSGAREG